MTKDTTTTNNNGETNAQNLLNNITSMRRQPCDIENVYCFEDGDCSAICLNNSNFFCRRGMCSVFNVESEQVINECDPQRGVLGFLIGDVQLGRFNVICKSIDLGIAPNNIYEENLMCSGINGQIDIDYNIKFPSVSDCTCPTASLIVVEGTRTRREYAYCAPEAIARYLEM